MGAAGSILRCGFTLGSGTTLGGSSGGWPWADKSGIVRVRYGTSSGVGGKRVVDGIQLEKRSRILELFVVDGRRNVFYGTQHKKLIAWTKLSEGHRVSWMR